MDLVPAASLLVHPDPAGARCAWLSLGMVSQRGRMRRQVATVATATMVSGRGEAGGDGVRPSARDFLGSPPPAASLHCPKVGSLEHRAGLPPSWGKTSPWRRCSVLVT